MRLQTTLLFIACFNAVIHWVAIAQGKETARRVSKTPFCLLLALYAYLSLGVDATALAAGLVFSAGGDFFLLFSHLFEVGMLSFMAAHVFYFTAFSAVSSEFLVSPIMVAVVACCAVAFWLVVRRLPNEPILRVAVCVYAVVILTGFYGMTLAYATAPWGDGARLMVLVGYVTFLVSDTTLAVSLWILPSQMLNFVVMFTYYIAQFLLTVGYVSGQTGETLALVVA